jgi:hypothetical protein
MDSMIQNNSDQKINTYFNIFLSAKWQHREDAGFHFRHSPSPVGRDKFS